MKKLNLYWIKGKKLQTGKSGKHLGREVEELKTKGGFTQNFLHTQARKTLIYILGSFEYL